MATIDGQFDETMRGPSWIIRMVILALCLFVVWASRASLDEIVRGDGEIVLSSRPQVIQNIEGGIVSTMGGVVRPGEESLQIIPLDEELFVEAKVKPQDIAGVAPGQKATVKLSAYDYTIYGALSGEVTVISDDIVKDARVADGVPHYLVTLKLDRDALTARQQPVVLRPGMQAAVELHTGETTVLKYLTKPLYRSADPLRER